MKKQKLHFGIGNAKLSTSIAIFDLPAGWTCPQADKCLAKVNPTTNKLIRGKNTEFNCFAATLESGFSNVKRLRWNNLHALKSASSIEGMANLINDSIPANISYVRIHSSGDFYSEKYFLAWLNVALNNPLIVFYGYTKSLNFLVKYKSQIPPNFRFTASYGGKLDHLISKHKLKYAKVVYTVKDASNLGLEIDHDDSHAIIGKTSYALLLHGRQTAGTKAAAALALLRRQGIGGYGRGNKPTVSMPKSIKIYVPLKLEVSRYAKTQKIVPPPLGVVTTPLPKSLFFHTKKKRPLVLN
jgi:hypothetical protein